jgi:hypothetical protein
LFQPHQSAKMPQMRLKDIIILKNDSITLELEENPNKYTLSFLSLVIHCNKFNSMLEALEEELVHTKRNYSYKDLRKEGVRDLFNWVKNTIEGYTASFDLPHDFIWQFFTLIYFHSFRDLDDVGSANIIYAATPSEISEILESTEEKAAQNIGALILFNQVSKEQLHKYIDDEWKRIHKDMEWLPVFPTDGSNFKDIYITDDIYVSHMEGKSFTEISEELIQNYPQSDYIYDDTWIRNKLSRYKKRIDEFNKKYPPEDEF